MSWLDDDRETKAHAHAQAVEQAARLGADRINPLIRDNISELGRRAWGEDAYSVEQRFEQMLDGDKIRFRCRWMCIGKGDPNHPSDTRLHYFHVDVIFADDGSVAMWGRGIALKRPDARYSGDVLDKSLMALLASSVKALGKINPLSESTLRLYLKDQYKLGPLPLEY